MRKLLLTLAFVLFPSILFAEDIYITQTASGSDTGVSCANAHSVAWFNLSGNWGAGTNKISASDTVHLCGTITSQLDVQGSGSAGNVITIYFEPNAEMSKPGGWTGGAIRVYVKHYITIDGGTNGVIKSTNNGTNLTYQQSGSGVSGTSANYLTVKNLHVGPLYVKVPSTENAGSAAGSSTGVGNYSGNGTYTHFTVNNCVIHDMNYGIGSDCGPSATDYVFTNNEIYNINWGIGIGDRNSSANNVDRVIVSGNNIHDFMNWDPSANIDTGFHHNGIFIYSDSGTTYGVSIFNNTFGPNYANPAQSGGYNSSTSAIYMNPHIIGPLLIYNNVFLCPSYGPSNGLIVLYNISSGGVTKILNNTFIGGCQEPNIAVGSGTGISSAVNIQNNLMVNANGAISGLRHGDMTITSNHNIAYNLITNPFRWDATNSGGWISWASWKTNTSQDLDLLFTNPNLDASYYLQAGSSAIGAGVDLSSAFTTDKNGNTRTAPWDIGAYKYGSVPSPYTVTASVLYSGTAAGKVDGALTSTKIVSAGTTTTFAITADGVSTFTVGGTCGGTLVGGTYTTNAINSNCTVQVTFWQAVTTSAGTGGTLYCPPLVQNGYPTTCTALPIGPYHTSNITGCNGAAWVSGNSYTTGNITSNCTVTATFAENTYLVTSSKGANVTITPESQVVAENATANFVITTIPGYYIVISNVAAGCTGYGKAGNTFQFGPVTANCSFIASALPLSIGGGGLGAVRVTNGKLTTSGGSLQAR